MVNDAETFMNDNTVGVDITMDEATQSTQIAATAALAVGTSIAFVTALAIALMVIPSWTTTALKFRSGIIPFADYPRVKMLRIAPDQTAYLKGLMFWGTLIASVIMGGIIGFLVALFLWPVRLVTFFFVPCFTMTSDNILAVFARF